MMKKFQLRLKTQQNVLPEIKNAAGPRLKKQSENVI